MNKSILPSLIIILLTTLLSAQQKDIRKYQPQDLQAIQLKGNSIFIKLKDRDYNHIDNQKGKFTIRDYYEYSDPARNGEYKLPGRTLLVALPPESKPMFNLVESNDEILNNVLPEINSTNHEVTKFNNTIVKPVLEIKGYTWYRNYYCAVVRINDVSFNEQMSRLIIKKGIKFEVKLAGNVSLIADSPVPGYDSEIKDMILNYEMAGQFRGSPKFGIADTSGSWFNYSQTYLKISTVGEGLFRIYRNDLGKLGIDTAAIDPHKFQLFESGVEQNIIVSNEESGVFGDSDYVEFYGTRNFSKISPKIVNADNEEYNEYLNRYTDSTFYFLTWGVTPGQRAYSISNPSVGITDTLNYYSSVIHHEPNLQLQYLNSIFEVANQTPNWHKNKSWYWVNFQLPQTIFNDTVMINNLYSGKTAKAFFKIVSGASSAQFNSHNVTFSVNKVLLDSEVVNRNDQAVMQGNISSDNLSNGANLFTLHNYDNGTDFNRNYFYLDWSELEYPRYLILSGDSLYFEFRENFLNKIAMIKVGNAVSSINDYEIFKVKPFLKRISNAQIVDGSILFSDTINTNDAYVILKSSNISKPKFSYKKAFVNLRQSRQSDYIAITHPLFLSSAQTYVNNIAQLYSVNPLLVNVNDIFDEFSYGYPYPQSIKDFIGNALQTWQSPLPSYLLLIGDADYDYKGYERKNFGIVGGGNYIPSYGSPVSDIWYAVQNDSISLPQMKVGRLPVNSSTDLNYYLSKVQNNFNTPYNDWNKHYLFFSGGDPDLPYQLAQFKSVNDEIIDNYIKPKPIAGSYTHFYKTLDPTSNFGPYTAEQFNSAISDGAVFISYLGHSGTSTWDNGIAFVNDLKNDVNGNPLITDFGCSTNKFAEPDIISFGEGFIISGQAIGYIANSSLGFISTAVNAPHYFYSTIIHDSIYGIGEAHNIAKSKIFGIFGPSDVFKIFSLCNTLLGDPIVQLKIPPKPNFSIKSNDVTLQNNFINEAIDSVKAMIVINNYGTSLFDSLRVDIGHTLNNNIIQNQSFYIQVPDYKDTIFIWLKTGHLSGIHTLSVTLNSDNRIPEIYTSDNTVNYQFSVESIEVKSLNEQKIENPAFSSVKFLNPTITQFPKFNYVYQISNDDNFISAQGGIAPSQPFFTKLGLKNLNQNQRYWFRIKVDGLGLNYSEPISFFNSGTSKFLLNDRIAFDNQLKDSAVYINGKLVLGDSVRISILSAGKIAGSVCKISLNGINLLSNSYFSGMGIVVFDPVTMNPDTSAWYNLFNNPDGIQQLVNLIRSIPAGKIVAIGVCDDAQNNLNDSLMNAIKTLGSTKINQLAQGNYFQGSWALIGKKGAIPGDVIEQIRLPKDGLISIDSVFIKRLTAGNFTTIPIGPASAWNNLVVKQDVPSGTDTKFKLLGIKQDNTTIDTLGYLSIIDTVARLDTVDAKKYPRLKIIGELNIGTGSIPPSINSLGVNYAGVPELGTNYESVTLSADTFNVGKTGSINFNVYNAGDSRADSVKVTVAVKMSDGSPEQQIYETVFDTINAESGRQISLNYSPLNGTRSRNLIIRVDPDNKIYELYKDNNTFIRAFNVKSDTLPSAIKITFDNQDIINNDYVSSNPDIKIELNDPTIQPITDTTTVSFYLNGNPVYYANNPEVSPPIFNTSNPKVVVNYKPKLSEGSYTLRVTHKDAYGVQFDSAGTEKKFVVSNNVKILYSYNYPDPMTNDTYFTFKLTQIPDDLKINIYTVAGRLIKQITKKSSELNFDFNRIYWDGKDQDGDIPANGVYLYKIIISKDGKRENITQKLAIMR